MKNSLWFALALVSAGMLQENAASQNAPRPLQPHSNNLKAPVLIQENALRFSKEEKKLHSAGATEVRTVISTKGETEDISVVRSCGQAVLDQRAVEAVARYRFRPGEKDGVPVRVEFYILVNFPPKMR